MIRLPRPFLRRVRVARVALRLTLAAAAGVAGGLLAVSPAPASAANRVTPGNFTGYGFDQCLAPTQSAMSTWRTSSPFWAVGIYISGNSRACRQQPNLTKAWIATQLRSGWRLLPITLGPQASCNPRFPRYRDDPTIKPTPGRTGKYFAARKQGWAEADKTAADAAALGIVKGSTLWYDLEGFDLSNTRCRESSLAFVSAWVYQLRRTGYVPGVYSSAGSGIKMLDDARVNRPGVFNLPDRIWIARWDGVANTSTSYIRPDGWLPGNRMKQYLGGHNETWGGVTINIDRNWLDLGTGSTAAPETHCKGVPVNYWIYEPISASQAPAPKVKALQCLLSEQGTYAGKLNGVFNAALLDAIHAWKTAHGWPETDTWYRRDWMSLVATGQRNLVKFGSAGPAVRRLQRALNASGHARLNVHGVFGPATDTATRTWQRAVGLPATGIVTAAQWSALQEGRH